MQVQTEDAMSWDREKIKQVLHELSKLPDFDSLPIPEEWGKLYDIKITPAKTSDLKDYLSQNKKTRVFARYDKYEVKQPDGGLREVKEEEPMTLITQSRHAVLKDQNGNEILEPLSESSALSTESNNSEQPVSQVESSTNVSLASHDGQHIASSSLRFDV